jgi:hypothetical protein
MKWKPITKEIPNEGDECIFCHNNIKDMNGKRIKTSINTGYFSRNCFYTWLDNKDRMPVTHWISLEDFPLPLPPKE